MQRFLCGLVLLVAYVSTVCIAVAVEEGPPQGHGRHYRVTGVGDGYFLTVDKTLERGSRGYLVDMLSIIADRANFTFEIVSPSGFGPDCIPQLNMSNPDDATTIDDGTYLTQYHCGANDVNEIGDTIYGTDMYLGLYYITPERQTKNYFTIPFQPPYRGTPTMVGTATNIRSIEDLVKQQHRQEQPAACTLGSTAVFDFLKESYPDLSITPYYWQNGQEMYSSVANGTCPILLLPWAAAANFVSLMSQADNCLAAGRPLGLIGEPMEFGLSHYAIGVGKHLGMDTVNMLSYWMNNLMIEGTLADMYAGGTGKECGYQLFPPPRDRRLANSTIIALVLGGVAVVLLLLYLAHVRKLRLQERRYKKRFVQQIARNIEIGPQPGSIRPQKLSEQILHIGQGQEVISKENLSKWMSDIKMDFISEEDFEALWHAMDINRTGFVNAVEFVVFLAACGPEFEKVYAELEKMPKIERLKLAARRLSK